jgi:hypothetical protein
MRWVVEFSEEVRAWYSGLKPTGKAATDRILERLASQGYLLRMPHTRQLGNGPHELRFTCENTARRITYVFDPDRRAVTLTTFREQRQNELGEVLRARRAQNAHEAQRHAARPTDGNAKKGRKQQ